MDMLYTEVMLQDREQLKRWKKGGDLLEYYGCMEGKDRIYYASRLGLIRRIYDKKKVNKALWLPDNLYQLQGKVEETIYTKKIQEVIDSIDVQDGDRQKKMAQQLSKMLDLCVMD